MSMTTQRRPTLYTIYLVIISLLGLLLLLWGLAQFSVYPSKRDFVLLVLLAAVSAIATTSLSVSDKVGITYHIGSVISLAAVPSFGVAAAAVIAATEDLCTWLIKPANEKTWRKSFRQLGFNTGMHAIAVFCAGGVLLLLRQWLGANTLWGGTLPWLPAAVVYEEVNLWLLIGVLRLQHGAEINPWVIWKEDRWASYISLVVLALGGGTLAFAIQHYDWLGIAIFFLPIILSAYAFRLYVAQMQTHLDNLEQIVADRTKDLADLNRQKDAFLAVLTHDMMTPLTSIRLCAEELADEPRMALENPNLIYFILRSQKTLFNMMRNILDIEKLQSGRKLAMHPVECNLEQLIDDAIAILHPEATEKNILIAQHYATQPLQLQADRQQMERILLNLVSNAVKYTPSGGSIWIEAHQEGAYVIVSVQDSGYGIPAAELPYIFDRFHRVEQLESKAFGTGLGLAITKALVEEHAGAIAVMSEEGKGSTFTVKLPVA